MCDTKGVCHDRGENSSRASTHLRVALGDVWIRVAARKERDHNLYERDKGEQLQRLQQQEQQLEALKQSRKTNPKHIALKDLPEGQRFAQLRVTKKHFVDTIKLIAYRAETALVQIVREKLVREDDARALVRQVLTNTVDLCPNLEDKTLTVQLHRLTAEGHDTVMRHLCEELTATETLYPGTDLRLIFEPVGANLIPSGQES